VTAVRRGVRSPPQPASVVAVATTAEANNARREVYIQQTTVPKLPQASPARRSLEQNVNAIAGPNAGGENPGECFTPNKVTSATLKFGLVKGALTRCQTRMFLETNDYQYTGYCRLHHAAIRDNGFQLPSCVLPSAFELCPFIRESTCLSRRNCMAAIGVARMEENRLAIGRWLF
jgi:hypothetical protein